MPTSTAIRVLQADAAGAIERARALEPEAIIAQIEAAGLRGRGGAGFPLARKLAAVRAAAAGGPTYVVANAYDADPASPLAATLITRNATLVLDGLAIAAQAVGAQIAYLYLHPEAAAAQDAAARGLATRAGAYGGLAIELVQGPGGFMGGEESALLAVLESRRAMARQRPPFPATQGLHLRPTLVSSAETLAAVPLIVAGGAAAFRATGTSASAGTKLVSVTGAVTAPGVYEVDFGTSLGDILAAAGGARGTIRALHVGGPTGGILKAARSGVALDYESLRAVGTHLGSGQIRALADDVCVVREAAKLFGYLAKETCGICVPCRVGTKRVEGILDGITSQLGRDDDLPWLAELGDHLGAFSLCGFGITSASIIRTTLAEFPDDYRRHIADRTCPTGTCEPVRARRYETMAQP
ncbi:MAG TPA: NADH-ubiquinone oxidoreductase-F iron-sulfur binding region domain-containing protein [Candidatus Limnocylindria bacterium]